MTAEDGLTDADHDALVQAFVEKWGLQEDAVNMLSMMSQAVVQRVMDEFNPRDVSRDATPVFLKFASSVAASMPQEDISVDPTKVAQFIEQWALGPEAQEVLFSMDPAMQARVLREFHPKDKDRDANGIFMKFTQGLLLGHPRKGGGKGKGPGIVLASQPWHPQQQQQQVQQLQFAQPRALRPQLVQQQVQNVYASQPGAGADDPVLQEFVLKWSLHDEAQAMLFGLDAASQMKVVQEFAPRDTSRDCSPVFCKFVQCLAASGGKKGGGFGGGGFSGGGFVPFSAPVKGAAIVPAKGGKGGGAVGVASTSAAAFIAQWNLGADAQAVFLELQPEAQQKVMIEFSPRDTSSPVDNIFMKFAQGVGGRGGKGKGKAFRASPY